MADQTASPVFTLAELARRLDAQLVGDGEIRITGINSVHDASCSDLTFIASAPYARRFSASRAGAAIVSRSLVVELGDVAGKGLLIVNDAELSSAAVLALFEPPPALPDVGVHPAAWVHPTVRLGDGARIGPHVSIDAGCVIGDRAVLHAGVRLYRSTVVGDDSVIHANTVIRERCVIGSHVILHQNVSIGADGFGYRPAPDGRGLVKIPHLGNVVIEDQVEIGPGTCVDRGKFGATRIGAGTKIDNLCQIGHNCRIGRGCVIVALTGFAGSVVVGDGCVISGGVCVSDHVTIGRGVSIGAMSGVMRDIPDGQTQLGIPAEDAKQSLRKLAALRKLPDLLKKLSRLPDAGQTEAVDRTRSD